MGLAISKSRIEASDQNSVVDLRFDGLAAQSFPEKSLQRFHAAMNKARFNFEFAARCIGNLTHAIPHAAWTRRDQVDFSIDVITAIETQCQPQSIFTHYLVNAPGERR